MTEREVNQFVDRMLEHLDRLLLNRDISEEGYHAAVLDISRWEEAEMLKANGIPRIVDEDNGVIVVSLKGETLRGWGYNNDDERRTGTLCAHEYVAGWCQGVKWCDGIDAAELFPVDGDTGKEARG